VVVHDGIKTIQNGASLFSSKKKNKILFLFKENENTRTFKKTGGLAFFEKKRVFLNSGSNA